MNLNYNGDNSYLFVNRQDIYNFGASNGSNDFPTPFCLGNISDVFSATGSREVSLNGNEYDFSVDYISIDKSDVLSIHKYLINKNNIK